MHEKFLINRQARINNFLSSVRDNLTYRNYIPLNAEVAVTAQPVSFADRLHLEYQPVHEKELWGYDWANGWFHFTAVIPENFAGKELCLRIHTGSEMLLFDDEGVPIYGLTGFSIFDQLYCKERFVIPRRFKAGEKVEFWMQSVAHSLYGCPLPNPENLSEINASSGCGTRLLKHMRLCIFDREMWGMLLDMRLLAGIMNSYAIADFRGKRMLQILNDALDIFNYDNNKASEVRRMLKEKAFFSPAGSSVPTAWATGHGHLDIGWLWPVPIATGKAARTFSSQIALLEKYPEYIVGASQAYLYRIIKENYPELYAKIKKAVAGGRWEVQGGMYVEADCNITSGESLIRQFLHGKNFFRDEFGVDVNNLWIPDVFGYSGNLPQISLKAGCGNFLTQKLSQNNFNQIPHHTFIWRGVDGSKLLGHFLPENTYAAFASSDQRIAAMNHFAEAGICDTFVSLYGIGDGGGGPSEDFVENNLRQQDLDGCPKTVFGRTDKFFENLARYRDKLPELRGELYFENHYGTLTSQSRTKRGNRYSEQLLPAVEFICSQIDLDHYPAEELDSLWKMLLLNQFHDILPGSSIHEVYEQTEKDYAHIASRCHILAGQAAEKLFIPAPGNAVLVNTLSVPYTRSVALPENWGNCTVEYDSGKTLPVQYENGRLYCLPELLPGSFTAIRRTMLPAPEVTPLDAPVLENELIRYQFNARGQLVSAFDKERNCQIMAACGNVLSLYHDRPLQYEAWNLEKYYPCDRLPDALQADRFTGFAGEVRSVLTFDFKFGKSTMTQQVILHKNSKQLDFATTVDFQESRMMLRTEFPVNVYSHEAAYDIQYAYIKRPTGNNNIIEEAQIECCGQRYADLSDGNGGVALLNDCKYGYRIKDNVIDLALLRSPRYPDADADKGLHHFTYSFLPHNGSLTESGVISAGAALNRAPLLFDGFAAGNSQPVCRQISGDGISLEVVTKAEQAAALSLRVVETCGKNSSGILQYSADAPEVWECDLMEWNMLHKEKIDGNRQQITLKPFEIKTFMVTKWQ